MIVRNTKKKQWKLDSYFFPTMRKNLMEGKLNPEVWSIFLSDEDSKELTEEEKKEILKLHKYFAHRNTKNLWDNLFLPAGRLRGKKKLVREFLDKCEVCRKYRITPSRPKVGLPKAKDMNEVVSLDLKIVKKSGNKEVAILYFHDGFSKLTKGQVINDKGRDTIINAIENKWIVGGAWDQVTQVGDFSRRMGQNF